MSEPPSISQLGRGRTFLVTLGRLPKGLELCAALYRAGARVIVADPFRWHLTRVSRYANRCVTVPAPNPKPAPYLAALRDLVEREAVTDVLPVSEETLHVAALAGQLPASVRLHCPDRSTLLAHHDKGRFMVGAAALGLPIPASFDASTAEASALAARVATVLKPRLSSAGHGVQWLAAGSALPQRPEPSLVQTALPGPELSTFSIAENGRLIGTLAYRGRVMAGSVAVCFEAIAVPNAVQSWVTSYAAGVRHSGFLSFDFRDDGSGRYLPIECNPRATSGVHFADPIDLAHALLDPTSATRLRYRRERVLQQFYPTLTETQGAALKGRPWRQNLRWLFSARDVTWSWRDPLPFLLQPLTSAEILRQAIFEGRSFGEAAVRDIGYYAEE